MFTCKEIILFLGLLQGIRTDHKLRVDVLFESLCPDSLNFIRTQLHPNWKDLSPYVELKLVPFGKSKSYENGANFVCQHGPAECRGNRLMSCALEMLQNQDRQVEFVNCFMRNYILNREELQVGKQCAIGVGLGDESVFDCYHSELGTVLQLNAERATSQLRPKFVPTILYNGQFIQKLQDDSLTNFRGVVCDLLTNIGTKACEN